MEPGVDNRSETRSNVFLAASLVVGAVAQPVRVRNLSTRGALLDGPSLPPPGARVRLVRGALSADGDISWHGNGQAGLRLSGEIDVAAWVKRVGHAGQQRVDEAISALRRQQAPPALPANPNASLAEMVAELDRICERLAASPNLTVEMGEDLVRLDAIARKLQQLADR